MNIDYLYLIYNIDILDTYIIQLVFHDTNNESMGEFDPKSAFGLLRSPLDLLDLGIDFLETWRMESIYI